MSEYERARRLQCELIATITRAAKNFLCENVRVFGLEAPCPTCAGMRERAEQEREDAAVNAELAEKYLTERDHAQAQLAKLREELQQVRDQFKRWREETHYPQNDLLAEARALLSNATSRTSIIRDGVAILDLPGWHERCDVFLAATAPQSALVRLAELEPGDWFNSVCMMASKYPTTHENPDYEQWNGESFMMEDMPGETIVTPCPPPAELLARWNKQATEKPCE